MWHRRGPAAAIVFVAMVGVLLVTWAATVGPSGVLARGRPSAAGQGAVRVALGQHVRAG